MHIVKNSGGCSHTEMQNNLLLLIQHEVKPGAVYIY